MIETTTEFHYFEIQQHLPLAGRKTCYYTIHSKSSGGLLGRIQWYGAWRQFCFFPEPGSLWNAGCLADIQTFIDRLMRERKEARK